MRYHAESLRRDYTFDVPVEELLSLLNVESYKCALSDHTSLASFLDQIPGISDAKYDGHFGPHVFASVDTEEEGWEHRVDTVDQLIGYFMDDACRLERYFPSLFDGTYTKRQPNRVERKLSMIYSDEDFVILQAEGEDLVLVGHADGVVDLKSADFVLDTIHGDVEERRFLEEDNKWLPKTPSRELADVRKWVSSFVTLPASSALPTVYVEEHDLAPHIPDGSRPVWANPYYVVCDHETSGLSVTYKTHDSTGTTWYIDGAREQIIDLIKEAKRGSAFKLAKFLDNKHGDPLCRVLPIKR